MPHGMENFMNSISHQLDPVNAVKPMFYMGMEIGIPGVIFRTEVPKYPSSFPYRLPL